MTLALPFWEVAAREFEPSPFEVPHDVQELCSPQAALNPAHLRAIDAALREVMDGTTDRLLISLPPQEGKSERVLRAGIPWWLHHRPADRIAVASFEKSTAERWGGFTRDDVERHGGDLRLQVRQDSRARGHWSLDPGPGGLNIGSVYCVGVGGPITGRPVDLMLIDDPVKGRAWVESALYRQRQWDWWVNDVRSRLGAGSKVIGVMTRWHEDDLFGRILASAEGERFHVLNIPALAEENDPLGRAPGEPLASVRGRTKADYEETKLTVGPYVWESLYQGHPTVGEGVLFQRSDLRYWHQVHDSQFGEAFDLIPDLGVVDEHKKPVVRERVYLRDCYRFVTVDLAASVRTSADWTVASAWALTLSGDLLLLDRVRARVEETEHGKIIEPLARRWSVDWVGVEDSGRSVNAVRDLTAAGIAVRPLKADTDKVTRSLPATARVKRHQLWLPAQPHPGQKFWLEEFVGELLAFPDGTHDDQVDTLSYAAQETQGGALDVSSVPTPREALERADAADLAGLVTIGAGMSETDWDTADY